jgi:hypothetical protein
MEREDLSKMISEWFIAGKSVTPQFGEWTAELSVCKCEKQKGVTE